jgi:prephenate dehydrogenase
MLFEQITIVGVGLIGASVGLAAKARGAAGRVVGVDPNAEALETAQRLGAIDAGTTGLADGVRGSRLIIVCTPVDRIAGLITAAARFAAPDALFTDVGSAKGGLPDAVPDGVAFVPAHPLAGSEKGGAGHAHADLFRDRVTVVTPARIGPAVELVEAFWAALGSRVVRMSAGDHDRAVAITSHLPHAVASAVAGATPVHLLGLAAGGFRDVTRIAASDPRLWAAIFEANRPATLAALTAFTDRLNEFRTLLEAGDRAGLVAWLAHGKQVRDALGT